MTNDEEHFEYQLKHGTHAISKENMLKIADLDRKRFLKIVNYLFLLHVTDDKEISQEFMKILKKQGMKFHLQTKF